MKKRCFAAIFILALVFASLPMASASAAEMPAFRDISQTAWHAGYVYALAENQIVSGTGDAIFSPDRPVTRAEFLRMLAAAVLSPEEIASYQTFTSFRDVPIGQWFTPYTNWGSRAGIAYGYAENCFRPGGFITREEAAAFMVRFGKAYPNKVDLQPKKEPAAFSDDASISGWAADDVYTCQAAGIIAGYKDGSFRPHARTTRGEAAVLLCGLLEIEPLSKSEIPAPPDPYFEVKQKLSALQKKFPSGKYWNHRTSESTAGKAPWEIVTDNPCSHGSYSYCNEYYGVSAIPVTGGTWSTQCLGFVNMLSDQIFGKDAPVRTFRDFSQLRPGDQIRLFDDVHSVMVVEKAADYITVAEVNADYVTCKISWGRKISREALESHGSSALYITRYKD